MSGAWERGWRGLRGVGGVRVSERATARAVYLGTKRRSSPHTQQTKTSPIFASDL